MRLALRSTDRPSPGPAGRRTPRPAPAVALAVAAAGLAGAGLAGVATTATAAVGSDDFRAGEVYRGDFPDPSVLRVGDTYYAYATNTGGKLLPAMTSTDLVTWRARRSETGRWWQNDALAAPAGWARAHLGHGKWRVSTWAPSVAAVRGGYVAAYAAPVSLDPQKMCVSVAYATRPLGPFLDRSAAPVVCPPDQGAIDPEIYTDRFGSPYLLWKTEGIARREPTRVWTRKLNDSATGWAAGSAPRPLLTTQQPWEGTIIENPSMVRYGGHVYLFYSANRYGTSAYAIGYALCRSGVGPCTRVAQTPLLATGGSVSGPGGPDAFLGRAGRLRLAYAAWDRGRVGYPASKACMHTSRGCNQRRLHVATLSVLADGRLAVADRG